MSRVSGDDEDALSDRCKLHSQTAATNDKEQVSGADEAYQEFW